MLRTWMFGVLVLAATPALAAPGYDAVAGFNPASATGLWSYGTGTTGSSFTAMTNASTCFPNTACWQPATTVSSVPLIARASATLNTGTVLALSDWLWMHPGQGTSGGSDAILRFTAPVAGTYQVNGRFALMDTSPSGVNVIIATPSGLTSTALNGAGAVFPNTPGAGFSTSFRVTLGAGDVVDVGINNAGLFNNDSTGVQLGIAAVPEPASWALLIGGFGLTGAMLRRRRTIVAA